MKEIKKWTLLDSEYLIRRPWLTARRDRVRLPDGKEMDEYYVLEYPEWCNIIALTKDGKMLIERQYRHAQQIVGYEIPAGVIEEGETPLQAAQRELYEETGYTGGQWEQFMVISPNAGACTNHSTTFIATGVEHTSSQHLEPTEDIAVVEMTIEEVWQKLRNDEFHQSLMAAPLWKYFMLKFPIEQGLYQIGNPTSTAIFAGGCFWGVQHQFEKEAGVIRTLVGYTGGTELHPTYPQVKAHETGHVEAVVVEFDPNLISYTRLCQIFFEIHDPAQIDGVGPDIGPQYRSEIFYLTNEQRQEAITVMEDLRNRGYQVNTLLRPAPAFWIGEEYHQQYYQKTGGEPYCHIRVKKF